MLSALEINDHKVRIGIFVLKSPEVILADHAQAIIVAPHAEHPLDLALEGVLDDGAVLAVRTVLGGMVLKADEHTVRPHGDRIRLRVAGRAPGEDGKRVRRIGCLRDGRIGKHKSSNEIVYGNEVCAGDPGPGMLRRYFRIVTQARSATPATGWSLALRPYGPFRRRLHIGGAAGDNP